MKTEAFAFQTLMLRERFHIHERAIEYMNKGYAVFMDRGLIGDLAFALMQIDKGFFTEEQKQVYIDLLEEGSDNPSMKAEPTQTIFLQITHEEAFRRLHTRNNKAEVDAYDMSYLSSLEEAYKKATQKVNTYVTYIDWSLDKKVNSLNMLDDDELITFLRETQYGMLW
jgi:deoxyadenosine/deoxycytidine kinase